MLDQFPRKGRLSSYDKVTLVLAKPLHGVVPKVIGLPLERAKAMLKALKLKVRVDPGDAGSKARIVWQAPRPGAAAAPGMRVMLAVKGG